MMLEKETMEKKHSLPSSRREGKKMIKPTPNAKPLSGNPDLVSVTVYLGAGGGAEGRGKDRNF